MKGILTEEELIAASKKADIVFREEDKGLQALRLCLVEGKSNSESMKQTGVHRTKIAQAKKMVLNAWRSNVAKAI